MRAGKLTRGHGFGDGLSLRDDIGTFGFSLFLFYVESFYSSNKTRKLCVEIRVGMGREG